MTGMPPQLSKLVLNPRTGEKRQEVSERQGVKRRDTPPEEVRLGHQIRIPGKMTMNQKPETDSLMMHMPHHVKPWKLMPRHLLRL